jgi:hypothetical protein
MPIGPSEGFAASGPGPTIKGSRTSPSAPRSVIFSECGPAFEVGRDALESDLPSRRELAIRRSIAASNP